MLTVAVRFRPDSRKINSDEDQKQDEQQVASIEIFENNNYVRINDEFNLYFDHVLGFESFQDDVFINSIRPKANEFLNGNNCCILTYGAKSSGKSVSCFVFF